MPEKTFHLEIQLQREPLSGDAHDLPSLRQGLLHHLEEVISMKGGVEADMIFIYGGFAEVVPAKALGNEPTAATFFRAYQGSGQVPLHRFRRGEARLKVGDRSRRVVAILQLLPGDGDRWWLAWRPFGVSKDQVGILYDAWVEREGEGINMLEDPFQDWLKADKAEVTSLKLGEPEPDAPEDIRMAVTEAKGTLPDHPCAVAEVIGRMVHEEVVNHGVPRLLVFVFRPGVLERWEVGGRLRVPVEDFVRAIASQGPTDAVAIVHAGTMAMPDGGEHLRCIVIMAERNGRVGERRLPLRFEEGKVTALPPLFRERGEVAPGTGWIGVAPSKEVNLFPAGIDGMSESMGEA